MITKQIQIKCRFCKTNTGSIDIPDTRAILNERLQDTKSLIAVNQESILNLSDDLPTKKAYETSKLKKAIERAQADVGILEAQIAEFPEIDPKETEVLKDILDSRCDKCEIEYGSVKEMEILYKTEFGDDHAGFIKEMHKHGFKKTPAFITDIEKKKVSRQDRELKEAIKKQKTETKVSEHN